MVEEHSRRRLYPVKHTPYHINIYINIYTNIHTLHISPSLSAPYTYPLLPPYSVTPCMELSDSPSSKIVVMFEDDGIRGRQEWMVQEVQNINEFTINFGSSSR